MLRKAACPVALICLAALLTVASDACAGNAHNHRFQDVLDCRFRIDSALDLGYSRLAGAVSTAAAGDTNALKTSVAEYFITHKRRCKIKQWPPHENSKLRADAFLEDEYILGIHPGYRLKRSLTWRENPAKSDNWMFMLNAFDILRSVTDTYRASGDTRYSERAKNLILDFIEDNYDFRRLPGRYSWYDHAVAYRAIYLVDFYIHCIYMHDCDAGFMLELLELVWRHAVYLSKSRYYSSKTNHGMFSNIALLRISLAFPEFRDSESWRDTAVSRMERQVQDNFTECGVHKEYSPGYHVLTTKLIERFVEDCRVDRRIELSSDLKDRMKSIKTNIPYFFLPDGMYSLIGDTQLLPAEEALRPLAAHNPYIRYVQTSGKRGRPPRGRSKAMRDAQIFVMRSGWGEERPYEEESCLIADLTAYGNAHQHKDFMSFELYAKGYRWITDLGPFSYNFSDPRRIYIKSSIAHNVVVPYREETKHLVRKSRLEYESPSPTTRPRRLDPLEVKLNQIAMIGNTEDRISLLEGLLSDYVGDFEDRILIMLAFSYLETDTDSKAAEDCLMRVIDKGSQNEYYDVASELLSLKDEIPDLNDLEKKGSDDDHHREPVQAGTRGVEIKSRGKNATLPGDPSSRENLSNKSGLHAIEADQRNRPVVDHWLSESNYDYLEGHFNYTWFFKHSRSILFVRPHYFLVVDRLDTEDPCTFRQLFHMPPDVEVLERSGGYTLSVGDSLKCLFLRIAGPGELRGRIVRGHRDPELQGWYSGKFGNFEAAPVVEYSFEAEEGSYFLAHLFVPAGKEDISGFEVEIRNGESWDPGELEPLHLVITEPHHRTSIKLMPSSIFVPSPKGPMADEDPHIKVARRRK